MSDTNFKTTNETYRRLFANGLTYRIPRFQRDYSWSDEQWEDLWADLEDARAEGGASAHYMGYLVLQSKDEKLFDVIDGQQRITTLAILVLAVLRVLRSKIQAGIDAEANQRRLDQIRQTYIGYTDPVSLVSKPKIQLNRNNNNFYQDRLVSLSPLPVRGFSSSEHLMRKASIWFEKKINELIEKDEIEPSQLGSFLAQFVEDVADRLFFTVITVTDELNAYKVFETLNARGVKLSSTDLLKNYLFSLIDKEGDQEADLAALERRWEAIVGRLGPENFPDFLRVYWMSTNSFVRQAELFKAVRRSVRDRAQAFELLAGLDENIDVYLGLSDPDSSGWSEERRQYASTLRLFSVRQPYALLMSASRSLDEESFTRLLRAIVTISFRYNVIGSLQPSVQERTYATVAISNQNGKYTNLRELINALSPIYPSDEAFRAAFAEKSIKTTSSRNRKIVKYILGQIEIRESGQSCDFESDNTTLEHILPEGDCVGYEMFSDEQVSNSVYRLGNMTLLTVGDNRRAGNLPYEQKRPIYEQSGFEVSRQIAHHHTEWTSERVGIRQQSMARLASAIWRVQTL